MKNELTVKLAMQLVVITITVMAVFIGARLWINLYEFNKEIETTLEEVSARIATTVNPTIWDIYKKSQDRKYSHEVANAILDAELKNPYLVAIKVYGNFGHLFMGKIRLEDGQNVNYDDKTFEDVSGLIDRHQRYPIRLDQMTIGNVDIFFTEAPLRQKLLRSFLVDLLQTFTIGLVTMLFLFYALRKSLVKPLIELQTAKHALESMSDGVAILSPDGNVLEINNAFSQQTGYDISDLLNKKLFMFKNTANGKSKIDSIWKEVEGEGSWTGEVETTQKNSKLYYAILSFTTIYSDKGDIIYRVLVIRDNTNEHRLQHSQRMETVGALAGGIAHDINNVLTPIMGWAELLSEDQPNPDISKRGLEHILQGTIRAKGMIDQIMNFSRMNKNARPENIDLKALIVDSISFVKTTFPASIHIQTKLCDEELRIFADRGKVEQVLINLYTNAMHAMEENGGRLTIGAEIVEDDTHTVNRRDQIHLTISDTGHGIPEEILDNIFEPYFTTKGSGKGNGFGLSTSLGIIEKMDGSLQVDTKVGEGSTFHIWLPFDLSVLLIENGAPTETTLHEKGKATKRERIEVEEEVEEEEEEEEIIDDNQDAPDSALKNKKILLVDDEVENLKLGESLLTYLGCQTESYDNSEEALAAFRATPERFDFLITDQSMPNMQGHELALAVRQIKQDQPVIVITGQNLTNILKKYHLLNKVAYVRKPFRITELKRAMQKLLTPSVITETNER
ncbi:hybrid sensor histidine kinase/response regulator [Sneathiella aquimaris]|uniref:hybrid sensor histidine kinase/response regulator n=1 Tax=Sneathiella aquimaris TaxID=2599305 RepID=UPI00146A1C4A|nr:ATP-binding protein [Sneathiella aquimaris]